MAATPRPILLYDGDCGLCTSLVYFMIRHDPQGKLAFAPLGGRTAQAFFRSHGLEAGGFDSLVFIVDATRADSAYLLRVSGALAACAGLGGVYRRLAAVLSLVPISWLDAAYRLVARVRHRIWGRRPLAALTQPEWRRRLLD